MPADVDFEGYFGINEFRKLLSRVQDVELDDDHLRIDLSRALSGSCLGIVPLASLLDSLRSGGTRVDVLPPSSPSWDALGWREALVAESITPPREDFAGLQTFRNSAELTTCISAVRETVTRSIECAGGVIDSLCWIATELADNVLVHSVEGSTTPTGRIQLAVDPASRSIALGVADSGRGILRSLSSSFELSNDLDAITRAIERGVTRDRSVGQGNGLSGSVSISIATQSPLSVMSGFAEAEIDGDVTRARYSGYLPGTFVGLLMSADREVDLEHALWGYRPMGAFEMTHLTSDDSILFRVADEVPGFGDRATGMVARTKLANILTEYPDSRVIVDFANVPLASASFCDEFLGKLFVELGVATAFSKFAIIGATSLIRTTLDSVIEQRSAANVRSRSIEDGE